MENSKTSTPALRPLDDTDVTTWELPDGAIARFGQGWGLDVEFSHDAAYFSVATKIGFWLYDTETLVPRTLWGTERGMMNVATFSHDSRWIATGDQDGILKVWDTQNGQCVKRTDWGGTENVMSFFMPTFHRTINISLFPVLDIVLSIHGVQKLTRLL